MQATQGAPRNKLIDLEKIKKLCQAKGLSISKLGRNVGLSQRDQIHRRLKNQYTINGDELILIADELGVSVDELRLT